MIIDISSNSGTKDNFKVKDSSKIKLIRGIFKKE